MGQTHLRDRTGRKCRILVAVGRKSRMSTMELLQYLNFVKGQWGEADGQ